MLKDLLEEDARGWGGDAQLLLAKGCLARNTEIEVLKTDTFENQNKGLRN